MAKVLKFAAMNPEIQKQRNSHMYHMSKANLGYCISKLDIEPSDKFVIIIRFERLAEHLDLDIESFKMLLSSELEYVSSVCKQDSVLVMTEVLRNHFNLGVVS